MKNLFIIIAIVAMPFTASASTTNSITEKSVFAAVNEERVRGGVPALEREKALDKVAEMKLEDIRKYDYWSHANPFTGSTPWTWFKKAGYEYSYAGENLALNFRKLDCLMRCRVMVDGVLVVGWMESPTHKGNIINPHYTYTGIAKKGTLIVQVFASKPQK